MCPVFHRASNPLAFWMARGLKRFHPVSPPPRFMPSMDISIAILVEHFPSSLSFIGISLRTLSRFSSLAEEYNNKKRVFFADSTPPPSDVSSTGMLELPVEPPVRSDPCAGLVPSRSDGLNLRSTQGSPFFFHHDWDRIQRGQDPDVGRPFSSQDHVSIDKGGGWGGSRGVERSTKQDDGTREISTVVQANNQPRTKRGEMMYVRVQYCIYESRVVIRARVFCPTTPRLR